MNFKIGQEVVCVKSHSQGIVKAGELYIIKDLKLCASCKTLDIDVGIINPTTHTGCFCGKTFKSKASWFNYSLFKPLDELYNKELNEIFSKQPFEL